MSGGVVGGERWAVVHFLVIGASPPRGCDFLVSCCRALLLCACMYTFGSLVYHHSS